MKKVCTQNSTCSKEGQDENQTKVKDGQIFKDEKALIEDSKEPQQSLVIVREETQVRSNESVGSAGELKQPAKSKNSMPLQVDVLLPNSNVTPMESSIECSHTHCKQQATPNVSLRRVEVESKELDAHCGEASEVVEDSTTDLEVEEVMEMVAGEMKETVASLDSDVPLQMRKFLRQSSSTVAKEFPIELHLVDQVNSSDHGKPKASYSLSFVFSTIACIMVFSVCSVMYILCNEEPLWMSLCLNNLNGQLQYKGSWKKTALNHLCVPNEYEETCRKPMHFDGFNSLFMLRRHYRCYTTLAGFSFDAGNVERKEDLSLEDFHQEFDAKKPVLISGLTDTWPARQTWTIDQLLLNYGDTAFKISQRTFVQFGEVAPGLLKDYSVPHLFQEDYFDVLDREKRPAFRWLIIGPERSGASWHVDPALTSAWNTLLCGRKRWALYPPGRVPAGVTVHVNEEDGDVNIETPSSLQWWLDFYPLLADEDKPIECTQLPGETIFVPSGWWHCVLNLETTVAVTQNFANSANFEFVCLDMAPGYQHKGVCRAGLLAFDESRFEDAKEMTLSAENSLNNLDLTRKEKRIKFGEPVEGPIYDIAANQTSRKHKLHDLEFRYDISFLEMFLDKGRDHYNSLWSSSNCMGQREMREWLWKLWIGKPGMRDLTWKGACLALNASKWYECVREICTFHELPFPTDDERLPVGMGSNPVYLIADHVIKLYVEEGLEASLHALGSELEFYSLLCKVDSPLKNHIPGVLASGILFIDNGSYKIESWDGKGVPEVITSCNFISENCLEVDFPLGICSKQHFDLRKAGMSICESIGSGESSIIWPYIVTKRCKGKTFAELRDTLSLGDNLNLASFLGEQLRNLHLLPLPSLNATTFVNTEQEIEYHRVNGLMEAVTEKLSIPVEWDFFIKTQTKRKKDVSSRLTK
ncbi:hypothetical protein RHGRI_016641 [Rhododendron griersonianum]|uniref:JmjC domain-containing protein n=1 Tax=Rhododendron griersonianum TaxID=479676 RepID=A0AAV6JUU9_9ERIC|nr:hypothetical protein RHGRI_016641 [Rhododendron griersonianum]